MTRELAASPILAARTHRVVSQIDLICNGCSQGLYPHAGSSTCAILSGMRHRKNRGFPDREIMAKAQGRFAKADKQRAGIKANPKREVAREQERARRPKKPDA